jgi:hypothetical protein
VDFTSCGWREGGRIYATAMAVPCLEAYYRYGRFLPPK